MLNRANSGFTLIEALVALVVLSVLFSTVWGWFGTATTSTERIQHAIALPDISQEFISRLELVDLQQDTFGEMQIRDYTVRWQSTLERRSDNEQYRRQPAWIVALFSIQGEIRLQQQLVSEFETKVVRQWQDGNYIDFGEGRFP